MRLKYLLGALCAAASMCAAPLASAAIPATETIQAVEFYHSGLDHYFISAEPNEIGDLDSGKHAGWARTGYKFSVIKAGSTYPGTVPMCRFYSPTLSSHFYTAKAQECEDVKVKFPQAWQFESGEVFRAFAVDATTGACPADTTAAYRLFNKRADVNHRYTDQIGAFVYMVGKGYQPEGDGNPALPVVFCTPTGGDTVPAAAADAPSCTVTASSGAPALGATLSLAAACTNNPTTFMWANCTSTQATCSTTRSTAGATPYTVYAANAAGPAEPVTVNVTWGGGGGGGGALPVCQISSSTLTPTTSGSLTLTANCNQGATAYEWTECNYLVQSICNVVPSCAKTSSSCTINTTIPGFHRYGLAGTNGAGAGQRTTLDIEWLSASNPGNPGNPSEPPPVCSVYASEASPIVGTPVRLTASCSNSPTSFVWGGVSCASGLYCFATSSQTGNTTYSVYGVNSSGTGASASVTVNWQSDAPVLAVPVCGLTASNPAPSVGSSISLTASCTNGPASYSWTGCASTGSTCTDSAASVGSKTYTIVATNANGNSQPASVTVAWSAVPTSPPVCQIAASSATPTVGQSLTLTASCTGSPINFQWTNCTSASPSSPSCTVTATAAGAVTYYVTGGNQYGFSNSAGVAVNWQAAGGGGGGGGGNPGTNLCTAAQPVHQFEIPWGSTSRYTTGALGGFTAETIIVMSMTVPNSPSSYRTAGYTSLAEYFGPPAYRLMTVSKSPCDFRAVDPTGVNGPFDATAGTAVLLYWNVGGGAGALGLVPGQTYYFNFKNISCGQGTCEASTTTNWPN